MISRGLALGLLLAACGTKARAPNTHHVEIRAMQFVPARLDVAVGDTVVWTNVDVVPHTVTSEAAAAASFDSQQIANRQQWRYVVTTPGELPYVCTYHPTMHGALIAR